MVWPSAIFSVLTLALIVWWPGPRTICQAPDLGLRVWGMLLQLIGAWTVWADLTSTAGQFGKTGIAKRFFLWLREPFRKASTSIVAAGVSATGAAGAFANATIRRNPLPGRGIEERFAAVEFNIEQLTKELTETNRSIQTLGAKQRAELADTTARLQSELGSVRASLEETATGNYPKLLFGLVWLAVGIVVATLSPELLRAGAEGRSRVDAQSAAIARGACPP
ncbi:hypothetical protein [Variovorax sp. HW608]|uniref:hypothetical protein n=1 Tax=Variovorax sp. HW608 TaxID=1034889 RepID=UPI0012FDCE12|nr:hypothetical protein [Variovorax sp. HW608]